jgi:hypothetical protein
MALFKKRGIYCIDVNQTLRSLLGGLPSGLGQTRVLLNPVTGQPYTPVAVAMAS